jgi:hypothetical protein
MRYDARVSGPTGSARESTPTRDPGRRSSAIWTNGERGSFAFQGTELPRPEQARCRTAGRLGRVSGAEALRANLRAVAVAAPVKYEAALGYPLERTR